MGNFFVGFRVRMQPQTMNAPTIAQKIQSGICCTVVFSVAQHHTSHYKALRIKSCAKIPATSGWSGNLELGTFKPTAHPRHE
jgi:hypothetical protein